MSIIRQESLPIPIETGGRGDKVRGHVDCLWFVTAQALRYRDFGLVFVVCSCPPRLSVYRMCEKTRFESFNLRRPLHLTVAFLRSFGCCLFLHRGRLSTRSTCRLRGCGTIGSTTTTREIPAARTAAANLQAALGALGSPAPARSQAFPALFPHRWEATRRQLFCQLLPRPVRTTSS